MSENRDGLVNVRVDVLIATMSLHALRQLKKVPDWYYAGKMAEYRRTLYVG